MACLSVGSEYFINSQELENKVRNLLPSQGGAGAGFDLSASTQIVPIIDLTESAEGSNVRADLQTALSFSTVTAFEVANTTTTIINTTGYFRIFGNVYFTVTGNLNFILSDGVSDKIIRGYGSPSSPTTSNNAFDFIVFLDAGDSVKITSTAGGVVGKGSSRQIADITGNLKNP